MSCLPFLSFCYMSSLLLYALQLNQNASQGAGVKAPYQSIFLPAPDTVGLAAPHPACLTAHVGLAAPHPACLTAHFPSCAGYCGAKPVPQGTSFARSDSEQELRPHAPPALRLISRLSLISDVHLFHTFQLLEHMHVLSVRQGYICRSGQPSRRGNMLKN